MKIVRLVILELALIVVCSIEPSAAEVSRFSQQLTANRSRIEFELLREPFNFQGLFTRYAGQASFDAKELTRSELLFRIDISSVNLQSDGQLGLLSLNPLFKTIPAPITTFKCHRIAMVDSGSYRLIGTASRAGEDYDLSLPVKVIKVTPEESVLSIKFQQEFSGKQINLSELLVPDGSIGRINARLVFNSKGERS